MREGARIVLVERIRHRRRSLVEGVLDRLHGLAGCFGLCDQHIQRVVDLGNCVPRKLYVNHRADDLYDTSAHLGSS